MACVDESAAEVAARWKQRRAAPEPEKPLEEPRDALAMAAPPLGDADDRETSVAASPPSAARVSTMRPAAPSFFPDASDGENDPRLHFAHRETTPPVRGETTRSSASMADSDEESWLRERLSPVLAGDVHPKDESAS